MMIASVLDYLKSDDELVDMLNHTKPHPKITAYKAHDKNAYPYVVVESITPLTLDILTGQYDCSLRVVTDDNLKVEKLTRKVTDLLQFGTQPPRKINNEMLFHSKLAGNGFLFDKETNVFEQVLNFSMQFKR